jgi:hypothetical protein
MYYRSPAKKDHGEAAKEKRLRDGAIEAKGGRWLIDILVFLRITRHGKGKGKGKLRATGRSA